MADNDKYSSLISGGIEWLVDTQNPDGGWGDTAESLSNLPTTLLCWAAIEKVQASHRYSRTVDKAKEYVRQLAQSFEPEDIVNTVERLYGADRTFSVPILTMCAICGLLGEDNKAWKYVRPLPFELAALSPELFKGLRLTVVSYALPALIAIGQINFHKRKPFNPVTLILRYLTKGKTLDLLKRIQPKGGGFLEAVPLTSFVSMSLIASENSGSDVVKNGIDFLQRQVRDDGSWPIDTNLASWVTTLSVNALDSDDLTVGEKNTITNWLLAQQHTRIHPYTNAAPGGWAWTDLPGGVPDADDTAGALLALHKLGAERNDVRAAAKSGIEWLTGLQNSDGGVPTFCRGWTKLPFDRSSPDITGHALAAMSVWMGSMDKIFADKMQRSMKRMIVFLTDAQRPNGSWIPLWFGNQYSDAQQNPVYGSSRVLIGLSELDTSLFRCCSGAVVKAIEFLLKVQNDDGGFGGDEGVVCSIEETSIAVDALVRVYRRLDNTRCDTEAVERAIAKSADWLIAGIENDNTSAPSPIGLYFAKLWYSEELYPLIFAASALKNLTSNI